MAGSILWFSSLRFWLRLLYQTRRWLLHRQSVSTFLQYPVGLALESFGSTFSLHMGRHDPAWRPISRVELQDEQYIWKQSYCFERLNQSLPQRVTHRILNATVWNMQIKTIIELNQDFCSLLSAGNNMYFNLFYFVAVKSMWISKGLAQIAESFRDIDRENQNSSSSRLVIAKQSNFFLSLVT